MHLDGVLDGHTWPEFEASLQRHPASSHAHIILDLSDLRYISSAGVSVFIRLQGEKQDVGGSVHLLRPTSSVAEVFKLLGLHALFSIVSDIESVYKKIAPLS